MTDQIAHFLQNKYIWDSPPNDVMMRAYKKLDGDVIFYAPGALDIKHIEEVSYSLKWLLRNVFKPKWSKYIAFSCTSEDPVFIAGVLSFVWHKPLIFLSDEIKSDSYRGNRPKYWKKICRWAMRRAELTIVNDESRVKLQRDYASLSTDSKITVYPGCFLKPPRPADYISQQQNWEMSNSNLALCFSGACNITAGIDWALESLDTNPQVNLILQPLAMDDMHVYLFQNHRCSDRIFIENKRLSWQESWASMGGIDIGVAIYLNEASQFKNMGISSNRLCMFLAMGVPVIVNKQNSFNFIEQYDCGVMVENAQEFRDAVKHISNNLEKMKRNALKCAEQYIDTKGRYEQLLIQMNNVLHPNK